MSVKSAVRTWLLSVTLLNALHRLSVLGRAQLGVLGFSTVLSALAVGLASELSPFARIVQAEFAAVVLGLMAFTMTHENQYCFFALVAIAVEQAAFLTLSTTLDSDGLIPVVRWGAVAVSCAGVAVYAGLQVFARGTWGWHVFRKRIVAAEDVALYAVVQQAHAALFLDGAHSLFSASAALTLGRTHADRYGLTSVVCIAGSAAAGIVLGPVGAWAVHREYTKLLATTVLISALALACVGAAAVVVSTRVPAGPTTDEVLAAVEVWCAVITRIAALCALATTFKQVFGRGLAGRLQAAREQATLIPESAVEAGLSGRRSTIDFTPVQVIDAKPVASPHVRRPAEPGFSAPGRLADAGRRFAEFVADAKSWRRRQKSPDDPRAAGRLQATTRSLSDLSDCSDRHRPLLSAELLPARPRDRPPVLRQCSSADDWGARASDAAEPVVAPPKRKTRPRAATAMPLSSPLERPPRAGALASGGSAAIAVPADPAGPGAGGSEGLDSFYRTELVDQEAVYFSTDALPAENSEARLLTQRSDLFDMSGTRAE